MVLHDVAGDAGTLEVASPLLHADRFRHGELHVVDVLAVPERLEDAVGEAQYQKVLHGLLAEVMIDAEHLALPKGGHGDLVELPCGFQIVAEGLFDDDAGEGTARLRIGDHLFAAEGFGDDRKELRWHRQVIDPPAAGSAGGIAILEFLIQTIIGRRLAELALHVEEALGEVLPHCFVHRANPCVLVARLPHCFAECVVSEFGARVADDGLPGREQSVMGERVERRDELALGEIA